MSAPHGMPDYDDSRLPDEPPDDTDELAAAAAILGRLALPDWHDDPPPGAPPATPKPAPESFEKHAYLSLADELSADPAFLAGADDAYVRAATAYARQHGLPWPPPADIDIALAYVAQAEEGEQQL